MIEILHKIFNRSFVNEKTVYMFANQKNWTLGQYKNYMIINYRKTYWRVIIETIWEIKIALLQA